MELETINRLYLELSQVATAKTAKEIQLELDLEEMRDAANVALGYLTGGMDGDWRNCDPVDLLRKALNQ